MILLQMKTMIPYEQTNVMLNIRMGTLLPPTRYQRYCITIVITDNPKAIFVASSKLSGIKAGNTNGKYSTIFIMGISFDNT
mmetsp:Transcript_40063/g.40596  ORF Transcript_40063/g.40596 Transcript_40063/m.40596 type:complete len:81 (+) Transcript_40063:648-890(+)